MKISVSDQGSRRPPSRLLHVLFFLSGGCGLIYEIVWTRLFTVVIGNTVFSVSAILSVFMAGLALGSRLGGRLADRRPIPLTRAYALLEAGIAIFNLFLPFLPISHSARPAPKHPLQPTIPLTQSCPPGPS